MEKKISLFNHKGGVSKTTTTFHLGWMLASKGYRVVMVDTDPQCNLTGFVLGYKGPEEFENFYKNEKGRNIRDALAPAFESRMKPIEPVECIEVPNQEGLFLLPGHIRMSEYEVTLGIAQELSGSIQTLQNLPGSISYLLDITAKKYDAEYILIDMSPSLSSINQNLLMTSNYFIVPTSPDYFSVMAIDSLSTILPFWNNWARKAASMGVLQNAEYPFPQTRLKFLGTIIQKFQPYSKVSAKSFQRWIDEINKIVTDKFVPILAKEGMLLPMAEYDKWNVANFCIASISDFKSLIAVSQENQTPVYALTKEQLGRGGVVLDQDLKRGQDFRHIYSKLADTIIGLTSDAASDRAVSG